MKKSLPANACAEAMPNNAMTVASDGAKMQDWVGHCGSPFSLVFLYHSIFCVKSQYKNQSGRFTNRPFLCTICVRLREEQAPPLPANFTYRNLFLNAKRNRCKICSLTFYSFSAKRMRSLAHCLCIAVWCHRLIKGKTRIATRKIHFGDIEIKNITM